MHRIAARIDELCADEGYAVSASFGVAAFGGPRGDEESLLRAADAAMYAAKRSGRRVQIAA